jgi:hypothetical protein
VHIGNPEAGDIPVTAITCPHSTCPHAHGHYAEAALLDMQEVTGLSPVSPTNDQD